MKNKKKNNNKKEDTHTYNMLELGDKDYSLYQLLEGMAGFNDSHGSNGWRIAKMDSSEYLRTEYVVELLKNDRIHSYHFCVGYAQEMYYKNKHDKKD